MFRKLVIFGALLVGAFILAPNLSPGVARAASGGYAASDVYGQLTGGVPDFTTSASGTSDHEINYADGTALDAVHHRLFVSDEANNRVLVFMLDSHNNATSHTAQYVLGQPNFTSSGISTTRSTLAEPYAALAYDDVNDRLFMVDNNNNRILVFNLGGGISNGMDASHVLGQPNFTSSSPATTQSGLDTPESVAFDSAHNRVFVADSGGHRVLVFDVAPGTIADGEDASYVLGQPNFTSSGQATTQNGMRLPEAVAFNATTQQLFVGDSQNYRVLVFSLGNGVTNGMNASYVLGEPNFTTVNSLGTVNENLLGYYQEGLGVDATRDILYVADDNNNRVLVFDLASGITNGMDATMVLGQPDFTSSSSTTAQDGISDPEGSIAVDPANNRIYVPDSSNNRVLVYDFVHFDKPAGALASTSAGVPFSTTLDTSNSQGTLHFSITSGSLPPGLTLNASTGVISGIPAQSGTYTFEAAVDDNNGARGTFPEDPSYTITVLAANTTASTPGAPNTGDGKPNNPLMPGLASIILILTGISLLLRRRFA